jgi:immune inhibitor A
MEFWSLMDSGNYVANGCAPTAYTAWEREAMGWIEIPTLTADTLLEIDPIDYGGTAYRIPNDNDDTGCEYYIIENIQQRGFNYRQRGHGLLVYHVNYNSTAFSLSSNSVNNLKGKPRMTVVPADGLLFAQYNVNGTTVKNSDFYNQLAGDPYPGTSSTTELNDTMQIVNFKVYNGDGLNKALADITENEEGTIKLKFVNDFNSSLLGISSLTVSTANKNDGIYTIDGRYVGRDLYCLPKGIYIQNGRKVVR